MGTGARSEGQYTTILCKLRSDIDVNPDYALLTFNWKWQRQSDKERGNRRPGKTIAMDDRNNLTKCTCTIKEGSP